MCDVFVFVDEVVEVDFVFGEFGNLDLYGIFRKEVGVMKDVCKVVLLRRGNSFC